MVINSIILSLFLIDQTGFLDGYIYKIINSGCYIHIVILFYCLKPYNPIINDAVNLRSIVKINSLKKFPRAGKVVIIEMNTNLYVFYSN